MKARLASILAFAGLVAAPLAAHAQEGPRPYDNGPVWTVSFVQTKPGHFDDYMRFLDTAWKGEQEDLKSRGIVLDYKVLTAQDARDNEPDLYLMVEFKNMAAFDASLDDLDAMTRRHFGSMTAAAASDVQRESIRTLRGQILTRQLNLK